ncbi:hypothetical protein MHM582_3591, partial [Microbacterium sp. HM58-2]
MQAGGCTLLGPEGPDALQPSGWEQSVTLGLFWFPRFGVAGRGTART